MIKRKYWVILISFVLLTIILNLAACFKGFCDTYRIYVYRKIADIYGRIMGIFPFAVGEIIMYLGAVMLLLAIIFSIILIFLRKKQKYKSFTLKYLKTFLMMIVIMLFIYTLNWVIPFRGTVFSADNSKREVFSMEEIQTLRNYFVEKINELADEVNRDAEGHIIYDENIDEEVILSMKKMGEKYPVLSGYYPLPKKALCSDFLEWMNIGGYTYPFTMEVTYNRYVDPLYYSILCAHELAHHKGYYQENEANFICFLAGFESDYSLISYEAYIEAYFYINDEYMRNLMDYDNWSDILESQPEIKDRVYMDIYEAEQQAEDLYEESPHVAEGLKAVSEEVADTGWEVQSDILKENSYDGVVLLLLQYYDGKLY